MNQHKETLHSFLAYLRSLPFRRPWLLIGLSSLLALAGGYLHFFELDIQSDRRQLINEELRTNRMHRQYLEAFGTDELMVLVICAVDSSTQTIEPVSPSAFQRSAMKALAGRVAVRLRGQPDLFPKVVDRIVWPPGPSPALLFLTQRRLQTFCTILQDARPVLQELAANPSLENVFARANDVLGELKVESKDADSQSLVTPLLKDIEQSLEWLNLRFSSKDDKPAASLPGFQGLGATDPDGYIFSFDGKLLRVLIHVRGNANEKNRFTENIHFSKQVLAEELAETSPSLGIRAGFAGMPVLEQEELETTEADFTRSAIIALVLVTLLFIIGFHSIVRPALAAICLCISIGITFVCAWLFIGHLNVLVLIFAVIQVALGIDFAIHFVTHYERALSSGQSPAKAIYQTYDSVGEPLFVGGITTAMAFFSAYFTEFLGLSELGIVAGSGLLVCLLCMTWVYPAMLYLFDTHFPRRRSASKTKDIAGSLPVAMTVFFRQSRLKRVIGLLTLLAVIFAYANGQYHFDTNILSLQASEGEANLWQNVLLASEDRSIFAVSLYRDRETLQNKQLAMLKKTGVVGAAETLFPAAEAEKREILQPLCVDFSELQVFEPQNSSQRGLRRQLFVLRQTIRKYRRADDLAQEALAPLEEATGRLYETLSTLQANQFARTAGDVDNQISAGLQKTIDMATRFLCPGPFSMSQLPEPLKERFLGRDSTFALMVYPAKNCWEQNNMEEFVAEIRQIEPNIAGELISLYENGQSIIRSFLQAAAYSFMCILVLILAWTRSVRKTLLSLLPLLFGVGLLLGLMKSLLNPIPWNFANFFALPILIGIGVDSGVHLVAGWTQGEESFGAAVKAVLFSSATTMIGFGILATGVHLGVRSLGLILFLGIGLILVLSLTLLPLMLELIERRDLGV